MCIACVVIRVARGQLAWGAEWYAPDLPTIYIYISYYIYIYIGYILCVYIYIYPIICVYIYIYTNIYIYIYIYTHTTPLRGRRRQDSYAQSPY